MRLPDFWTIDCEGSLKWPIFLEVQTMRIYGFGNIMITVSPLTALKEIDWSPQSFLKHVYHLAGDFGGRKLIKNNRITNVSWIFCRFPFGIDKVNVDTGHIHILYHPHISCIELTLKDSLFQSPNKFGRNPQQITMSCRFLFNMTWWNSWLEDCMFFGAPDASTI